MKQLSIFDEVTKTEMLKPWWIGTPCSQMGYFDLLAKGATLRHLGFPWLNVTDFDWVNMNYIDETKWYDGKSYPQMIAEIRRHIN